MPPSILRNEPRWIAVAKPAGQLVIAGRGVSGPTLREEVETHLHAKVYVVHRLDREASGVVLFAKDGQAHRSLCIAFESRKVEKLYLALVHGEIKAGGIIDRPIRAYGSGRQGINPDGKPSVTRYQPIQAFNEATLLEVRPETGRRHQIRVHLYSIGHPIVGDPLYGEKKSESSPRLMLHALGLNFDFETDRFELHCDVPVDFTKALKKA